MSSEVRFVNPLGNDPGSDAIVSSPADDGALVRSRRSADSARLGRRSALTPECLEPEDELADPAASENMYYQVLRAVQNKMTRHDKTDNFKLNPEREVFERRFVAPCLPKGADQKPDWHSPITEDHLRAIMQVGLQLSMGDQLGVLMKEASSGSELMEWWDAQSGVDTTTTDPFQLALAALEEGNMISPTSEFRGRWDMAQAAFLIYIAFALPYRLGFDEGVILWSFWFWFDAALDIYFVIDMFVNFKTAVITADGEILHTQQDIASSYLRGWFVIDFISCLPVGYIEYVVDDGNQNVSSTKGARLLRLFRLLKLLRLVRIKRLLERWEEELYGNTSIRIGKMLTMVGVLSHWSSCGWYFCGDGSGQPDGTEDGWVQAKFNDTSSVDGDSLYFASFFWSAMSIVKVQTADPVYKAVQLSEQAMTLLGAMLGTFVTSVVIGQVADMIAHSNPAEKARNDAIGVVHGFLHERRVAPWLTRKIRGHYRTLYAERGTAFPVENYFVDLPMKMRRELAVELGYIHNHISGKRGLLTKVPFCWDLSMDDMILICCRLQAQKFGVAQHQSHQSAKDGEEPDTYIMREGEIGDEMFIITEGSVRIERNGEQLKSTFDSDENVVQNLGKLQEFDFFGELAVLTEREDGAPYPRTRSAVCASNSCIVQSLSYASLKDARVRSPTIDAAVRQAASQIYMQRPSLRRREQTSTQQRFEKLEELNAQVLGLQKEIAEQMMGLKHSIAVAS